MIRSVLIAFACFSVLAATSVNPISIVGQDGQDLQEVWITNLTILDGEYDGFNDEFGTDVFAAHPSHIHGDLVVSVIFKNMFPGNTYMSLDAFNSRHTLTGRVDPGFVTGYATAQIPSDQHFVYIPYSTANWQEDYESIIDFTVQAILPSTNATIQSDTVRIHEPLSTWVSEYGYKYRGEVLNHPNTHKFDYRAYFSNAEPYDLQLRFQIYDPVSDTYELTSLLQEMPSNSSGIRVFTVLVNEDKSVMATGIFSGRIEVYDPSSNAVVDYTNVIFGFPTDGTGGGGGPTIE